MKISKQSWHYQLLNTFNDTIPEDVCSYFRTLFLKLCVIIFVFIMSFIFLPYNLGILFLQESPLYLFPWGLGILFMGFIVGCSILVSKLISVITEYNLDKRDRKTKKEPSKYCSFIEFED